MRGICRTLVVVAVLVLAGCAAGEQDDRMSYKGAVRKIGRPPTRSVSLPDGGVIATWSTQVPGGRRDLVMTFDADRQLVGSETRTVPAGRRR